MSNSLRPLELTIAYQAPPSMGFSRQEYWSGLPFPSLGHLPNPGIEPKSPSLQTDSLPAEPQGKPKNNACHLESEGRVVYQLVIDLG